MLKIFGLLIVAGFFSQTESMHIDNTIVENSEVQETENMHVDNATAENSDTDSI
jgi:hypothetical protein